MGSAPLGCAHGCVDAPKRAQLWYVRLSPAAAVPQAALVLWPFVQVWLVRSMGSAAIASFLANTHHAPWLRAAVLQNGDTTSIRYVHSSVAALRGKAFGEGRRRGGRGKPGANTSAGYRCAIKWTAEELNRNPLLC